MEPSRTEQNDNEATSTAEGDSYRATSLEISRSLFNYLNAQLHAITDTHSWNGGIGKTYR